MTLIKQQLRSGLSHVKATLRAVFYWHYAASTPSLRAIGEKQQMPVFSALLSVPEQPPRSTQSLGEIVQERQPQTSSALFFCRSRLFFLCSRVGVDVEKVDMERNAYEPALREMHERLRGF